MGTGEGAQAYGWGTYVTEVEGIGKSYAEKAADPAKKDYLYEELTKLKNIITVSYTHLTLPKIQSV